MRRDLPEVIEVATARPLPWADREIVRVLTPLVTPERLRRMQDVAAARTRSLIPVLEDLADPHNGAAVMRSADAFGCHEVHVVEDRHPFCVSHRVTRGTHRWLELHKHESTERCLAHLAERGYAVYVAAMDGDVGPEAIARVPRAAIVFGNEHRGVSQAVRDVAAGTYAIPMVGFVESLNVSVASAITLYVASRGRHGDLDEAERDAILARYLVSQIADAEAVLERELTA